MSKSKTYVVAEGHAISMPEGLASEGMVVSEKHPNLQEFLSRGVVVEKGSKAAPVEQPKAPPKPGEKWGLDPDGLKGLSLTDLNLMVVERDPAIKPFETVEEAIAQLSKGYKP